MTPLEKQNFYVESVERFKGGGIERMSWDSIHGLLNELLYDVPVVTYQITTTSKIVRGRHLGSPNRFDRAEVLLYPPADKCHSFGRCNKPARPVLYGAVGYNLIFSELHAEVGDVFGLAFLRPQRTMHACILGALDAYRRTEGACWLPDDTKKQIEPIHKDPAQITAFLFDAFISDYFGRPGNDRVYKLTSAYSSALFESFTALDAIYYESVDHKEGTCLAIRPDVVDSHMLVTDVQLVRITNHLGYGIYDFEEIARSKTVKSNLIEWT